MTSYKEPPVSEFPSLSVGAASDVGRVRDENEDAYGHFTAAETDGVHLFIVADGMGGHARGREASTTTVAVVREAFFNERSGSIPDRLERAFREANRQVYDASEAEETDSMGTTATVLAVVEEEGYVAHVGDSRAYRYRAGEAEQLTQDHTVVQELRRSGAITEEEARTHPRRGVLTRAVGVQPTLEVELRTIGTLRSDDRFLLCTDGLQELSEDTLREVALNNAPQSACEELVRRAKEEDGHDNATVLIVHVGSS
jgi:protein phosphatase